MVLVSENNILEKINIDNMILITKFAKWNVTQEYFFNLVAFWY